MNKIEDDNAHVCQVCKKQILESDIKVPRVDDDETHGYAHRECENNTNPYMKWSDDGFDAQLTLKGYFFQWIKMWFILATMINEKLHGRSIFDDDLPTQSQDGNQEKKE